MTGVGYAVIIDEGRGTGTITQAHRHTRGTRRITETVAYKTKTYLHTSVEGANAPSPLPPKEKVGRSKKRARLLRTA